MDQILSMGEKYLQSQGGGGGGQQHHQGGGGGSSSSYGGQFGGGNNDGGYGNQGQYGDNQGYGGGGGRPQGGFDNDGDGQSYGAQGGAQWNRPAGGQSRPDNDGPNLDEAARHASAQSGNSGDMNLFSSVMGRIQGGNHQAPIDEQAATQAHDQAYNQGNGGSLDAHSMGMAAALQAFKQFQGGNSGGAQSGSGGGQNQLIGLAMAQASKLFDSSGGAANGNKEDVVSSAGQTIMKLLVQAKLQSATGGLIGGGNSGGLGGLAGMASKFM